MKLGPFVLALVAIVCSGYALSQSATVYARLASTLCMLQGLEHRRREGLL
jgi:hypothetical protein